MKEIKTLVILILFSINCQAQLSEKNIQEVVIYSKKNTQDLLKNVIRHISKNYMTDDKLSLKINHTSKINQDTVICFDGDMNIIMPDYEKTRAYYANKRAVLCTENKRNINVSKIKDWFYKNINKDGNVHPIQRLGFFINSSIYLSALKVLPFIENKEDYDYVAQDIDKEYVQINFTPNKKTAFFSGNIIVNKQDFSIKNFEYANIDSYDDYLCNENDTEKIRCSTFKIKATYAKHSDQQKYSLESFDSSINYLLLSRNEIFNTSSHMEFKENNTQNCKSSEITLSDLGLYYPQNKGIKLDW